MIAFEPTQTEIPESEGYSVAVIGIGGAGCNLLDRIALDGIDSAALVAMNADVRALANAMAPSKIQLGRDVTRGLGAGGDPELGREAATASIEEIRAVVARKDIVLICTGLGGGTGCGAAPFVARAAREAGAFVVAFSIMPFLFEGRRRRRQAEDALGELSGLAHALMTFENGRMGELVLPKEGIQAAFAAADEVVSQSVRAVLGMVQRPGLIRIGLDDLLSALRNPDSRCLFGFGQAKGDNRAQEALARAMRSPLLDRGEMLERARNIVVHVCGGNSMTLYEVELLMGELGREVTDEAQLLFGVTNDPRLGDALSVTIISSLANVPQAAVQPTAAVGGVSTVADASAAVPGAGQAEDDLLAGLEGASAPRDGEDDATPVIEELLDFGSAEDDPEEAAESIEAVEAIDEESPRASHAHETTAAVEARDASNAAGEEEEESGADVIAADDEGDEAIEDDAAVDSPFTEIAAGADVAEAEEAEEFEDEDLEIEAEEEVFEDEVDEIDDDEEFEAEEEVAVEEIAPPVRAARHSAPERNDAGDGDAEDEDYADRNTVVEPAWPGGERRGTGRPAAADPRDALDEDDDDDSEVSYRGRGMAGLQDVGHSAGAGRDLDPVDDGYDYEDEPEFEDRGIDVRGQDAMPADRAGEFDDRDGFETPRRVERERASGAAGGSRRDDRGRDWREPRAERDEEEPVSTARTRKPSPQGELEFEPASRGRFDRGTPTIVDGEDLDVPTFLRQDSRRGGRGGRR